jgi:hypothetical protein
MFDAGFAAFVVGIVVLIFLLSLLLSAINNEQSQSNGETDQRKPSQQHTNNTSYQHLATTIADAIHTYRHYRRADDRHRAQRERVSISILGLTAIFAFFAAIAGIVSAVFFYGQLSEMRIGAADTKKLAEAASKQATAAERLATNDRAWLLIAFDSFDPGTEAGLLATYNSNFSIHNYGTSPAILHWIEIRWFITGFISNTPDPDNTTPCTNIEVMNQKSKERLPMLIRGQELSVANDIVIASNDTIDARATIQCIKGSSWRSNSEMRKWFYAKIQYEDVRGSEGETAYYVDISPMGGVVKKVEDKKYNYRK